MWRFVKRAKRQYPAEYEAHMPQLNATRSRTHPRVRFATQEAVFDLLLAAQALLTEPTSGHHGHRQMALFKHGPMTLALYLFESGSKLPNHVVDGPIILHVLDGEVAIRTSSSDYQLSAGQLLRLAPRVEHDISALQESRLLLTFCLEGPDSHRI
ncbi:MAG TPA: hypothetical protein P5223_02105 [Phycisphaerae bacterium]|nr:hypothetical protein [Phycisphaerae bacterium]